MVKGISRQVIVVEAPEPRLFEQSLHEAKDEIILSNKSKLLMTGSIDRIDVYETGEKAFLRVIDYKSSERSEVLSSCVKEGVL